MMNGASRTGAWIAGLVIFLVAPVNALLAVGMPHFDRGNVFGALVVCSALSAFAGGAVGLALGISSARLTLIYVGPLLLWLAVVIKGVVAEEAHAWSTLGIEIARAAGSFALFHLASVVGRLVRPLRAE